MVTLVDLVKMGTLSVNAVAYLWPMLNYRRNVVIVGPTGAGKSLLNALLYMARRRPRFSRSRMLGKLTDAHRPSPRVCRIMRVMVEERVVRRVVEIAEHMGVSRDGRPRLHYVFRWNPERDALEQVEESRHLETISRAQFVPLERLREEYQRRRRPSLLWRRGATHRRTSWRRTSPATT